MATLSDVKPLREPSFRIRQNEINNLMPYFAYMKLKGIKPDHYEGAIKKLKERFAPNTVDGIQPDG
ncbi:hypothetical protein [Halalkalibacter akibai]|uniref:hypothetical protein n=1 Tax=Halalkalibacter akibai TaxID=1411 RepID=UPI00068DCA7A